MIESVKDLGLDELDKLNRAEKADDDIFWSKLDEKLKEKLNLSLGDLKLAISNSIEKRADDISADMFNIAPFGDYGKLIENTKDMSAFLKVEGIKPENWTLNMIAEDQKNTSLIRFLMSCKAVDDGDSLKGTVFVSKSGVIRHVFAQADS